MTPRRLPFGGGNNNGTPRSNRPGNYQPNRGGESNYNNNHSRGPRPTRDGYYNSGEHGGSRAQGSQYGRGGSSGRQARSRQGGNRSSHYIDSNEAYYAGEDEYEVDDFGYDDDGYFGEDMDGDYDEGYDEHYGDCEDQDVGADDGYYGEEYGDGFHNEFQFEDPDGLLEDDPSPEELNIAEDLEDGYYMDNSSSGSLDSAPSSLPVLRRQQGTVASSSNGGSTYQEAFYEDGSEATTWIPPLVDRPVDKSSIGSWTSDGERPTGGDGRGFFSQPRQQQQQLEQLMNSSNSSADDVSETSSSGSAKVKQANNNRAKAEPIGWQRNSTNAKPTQQDLSPHTIGQAYEVGGCTGRFIFRTLFDSGSTSLAKLMK